MNNLRLIYPDGSEAYLPRRCFAICNGIKCSYGKNSKLHIEHLMNIGPHYARTLREWRVMFIAAKDKLLKMGYDHDLQRKWLYYLYVCKTGSSYDLFHPLRHLIREAGG
ncbi:MAG: class I SAM-dependent methyltransferase [Spirochaetes bacterium]|jgi:cyclopropane-fatty-acyl-phospholipid synthase|nr:class I SAM-dependent methyltransferase [Spirochaetota bacterium]